MQAHCEAANRKQPGGDAVTSAVVSKRQCSWTKDGVDQEFFDTMMSLLLRIDKCHNAILCSSWVITELPMGQCSCTCF